MLSTEPGKQSMARSNKWDTFVQPVFVWTMSITWIIKLKLKVITFKNSCRHKMSFHLLKVFLKGYRNVTFEIHLNFKSQEWIIFLKVKSGLFFHGISKPKVTSIFTL